MIFVLLILAAFAPLTTLAQTKFVKSVPTLTELRALNVADIHTNVLVNSYWTSNTNSIGAIFQWVPGATDTTNTYSVFAPASGSGRWFRVEMPANPGSASQPGFRFFDNQRSGWFSGLGTNIIAAATDGTERWRIGSTGILQANGAQTVQTSSGTLTVQPAGTTVLGSTSGSTGIGTTGPDRKLDVLDAGGSAQFRTTYTDGSVYTDYQTLSGGSTYISDSSGRMINSTIVNNTAVNSRARQGGLAFDGVTASTKDVHTIPSVGTSDNTLRAVFQSNASQTTFTSVAFLGSSVSYTHVAAGSYVLRMDGNSLLVLFYGATTSDYNLWTYTGFGAAYNGKIADVAVVKSSSGNVVIYINGVDVSSLGTFTTAGTPPTWQGSIPNTYLMAGAGKSDAIFNGTIYGVQLYNRALSASEVVDLANKGVSEGDKWASLTALYTSSFTVGTDSWTVVGASAVTRDAGPTGGQTDNLKIATTVANNAFASTRTMSTSMVAGKRYRLTYSYYMDVASNVAAKYFGVWSGSGSQNLEHVTPVDKAWTTRTIEFTSNTTTAQFAFYLETAPGTTVFNSTNATDALYLRGITVTEIGCLLDPDLAVGVGYQAPDQSSNHYDGLLSTSGVSHTIEQRRGQARFSLSADGYLGDTTSRACIPDNARIESITAYSTGTPTFTVGDDSGSAANVVGSVTLTASTLTDLTLLKRFLTTGTDGRCYVDFTAGAAATTFTITYSTTGNY